MNFFFNKQDSLIAEKTLKTLFYELDFKDVDEQYTQLLTISKLLLQMKEIEEGSSYLLQASLINPSYEPTLILLYIAIYQKNSVGIQNQISILDQYQNKTMTIFSFEELNIFIDKASLTPENLDIINQIEINYQQSQTSSLLLVKDIKEISFTDLIHHTSPQDAENYIKQAKEISGLTKKYPHLNTLSISSWEKEYQNRKTLIAEKEILIEKNIDLKYLDFIELGKMYLLEDEFSKAAECFTNAKNIYITKAH